MKRIVSVLIGLFILASAILWMYRNNDSENELIENDERTEETESIEEITPIAMNYVALGDSLTAGIGDQEIEGGFVQRVANELSDLPIISSVNVINYGVPGDRIQDLHTLVTEDQEIREAIEQADFLSITIGGNDATYGLRQIAENEEDLKGLLETLETFTELLEETIDEIRFLNASAQLYLYGLYNPFHYYLAGIEDLNTVFHLWNQRIEEQTIRDDAIVFIEIDSAFNPPNREIASEEERNQALESFDLFDTTHPFLYENDWFHPNEEGYQMMAQFMLDQIEYELESDTVFEETQ